MTINCEPRDFMGEINITVERHGVLTPGYFTHRGKINTLLAQPAVILSGAPHLNNGSPTFVRISEGTVEDYVGLVKGIYPNAVVTTVDNEDDSGSKQALRSGRLFGQ